MTITTTLTWVRYDGTPETLPEDGERVLFWRLGHLPYPAKRKVLANGEDVFVVVGIEDSLVGWIISKGDMWAVIPESCHDGMEMKAEKITPSPWSERAIAAALRSAHKHDGSWIDEIGDGEYMPDETDAGFIAAAPGMYRALKAIHIMGDDSTLIDAKNLAYEAVRKANAAPWPEAPEAV